MSPWRLIVLLPLVFIVWWFYALFTTIIPWLSITVANTLSITWLQIVCSILFFLLGIPALIVSVVAFFEWVK